MIESLVDTEKFRRQRGLAWDRNIDYWLAGPLRHVDDVGDYIASRVAALCQCGTADVPVIVDMGFGNAWLLHALLERRVRMSYVGLDSTEAFVHRATASFRHNENATFLVADLEKELDLPIRADVVVNAFNFFELCDLAQAMANVSRHLRPGGRLFMSTIDKTYLILALSKDSTEFRENLCRYQQLPGTKYGFQHIDLGSYVSETLEYPSVLYTIQDFIDTAHVQGLRLVHYVEHPFTAKPVPKIYCHLEFQFGEIE